MSLRDKIVDVLRMQAYERGHSSGEAEVESILQGLMWDFKDILEELENGN